MKYLQVDRKRGLIIGFVVALSAAGCGSGFTPLVKLANELYPPVDPADKQLAATESASGQLGALSSALLYAAVSARDLQGHLPDQIKIKAVSASTITVTTGDQEVIVAAGYEVEIPAEQIRIVGTAEVHCAAAVENSVLVLRPSASHVQVDRIDYKGKKTAESLLPIVNAVLATFLNNLNGAIVDSKIPLSATLLQSIDPRTLLASLKTVSSVSGQPIALNIALGKTAVFIDHDGVHVLADAVVLSQARIPRIIAELNNLAATPPPSVFTSEQLALLSECGTLAEPQNAEMKTFQAACATLVPRTVTATATSQQSGGSASVRAALSKATSQLRQLFVEKAGMIDSQQNLAWDRTTLALSRAALAADLNEALSQAQASASLVFPHFDGTLKQTIRTDPAPDLKCSENAGGCDSNFTFRPYNPRGCDSNCSTNNCNTVLGVTVCLPGIDLACLGRKTDCERLKEQERIQYESDKALAQVAFAGQKAACELLKAATKAGCQANQGWLDKVGGQDVGEIQAAWAEDDGEMDLTVKGIQVGGDFDSLTVHGLLAASALVGADFTLVPHNLGTVVCVAQWSGRVHAKARVAPMNIDMTAKLVSTSNQTDKLTLTFEVAELPVQLTLDPSPVAALIGQNPQIALACPVPALVFGAIAGQAGAFNPVGVGAALKLGQAALKDTVEIKVPARQVTLEIPARTITIGREQVTLVPRWEAKSVVISH